VRINLADWERAALAALDPMTATYYASGSRDERTLHGNRAAWQALRLRHRVLVDVSDATTATTVLGRPVAHPILTAPTAFHGLAHPQAERATARGTAAAGGRMVLSTLSNTAVEEVASLGPTWFQLYVYRDRAATGALVDRVAAAGCQALVVTCDAAVLGTREGDVRTGFHLPAHLSLPNAGAGPASVAAADGDSGLARYVAEQLDPSLGWDDVAWLRDRSELPLVLKGIVRGDDAARAADLGVAGIVVSNHGGRQLDAGLATARALPEVVEAVDGRCEVYVDGGIRRGTDVLAALALGARAVLVGRPVLWGLAVDGADGVQAVLRLLQGELLEAMQLAGAPTVGEVTADLVTWERASHA